MLMHIGGLSCLARVPNMELRSTPHAALRCTQRTHLQTLMRTEALVTPPTETVVRNNSRGETFVDELIPKADSVRACHEALQDLALSPGNIPRTY